MSTWFGETSAFLMKLALHVSPRAGLNNGGSRVSFAPFPPIWSELMVGGCGGFAAA